MTNTEMKLSDFCDAYFTHGPLRSRGFDLNYLRGTYKIGRRTFKRADQALEYAEGLLAEVRQWGGSTQSRRVGF